MDEPGRRAGGPADPSRSLEQTLTRYPPAARVFCEELYEDHWQEAAWLYERREELDEQRDQASLAMWHDVEARALAHVDALALGGRMVAEQWIERGTSGEPGELHTAVRLACRAAVREPLHALLAALDGSDHLRALAVEDAMAWELADDRAPLVIELLEAMADAEHDEAVGVLTRVIGRRRWPAHDGLGRCLAERRGDLGALAWALGRLGAQWALPGLYGLLRGPSDADAKQAAALACVRLDPGQTLFFLRSALEQHAWAALPLAMVGGHDVLEPLLAAAARADHPERWWPLGVLGHAEAIAPLLDALVDPAHGSSAAEALHLLTGAELYEEVPLVDDDQPEAEAEAEPDAETEAPAPEAAADDDAEPTIEPTVEPGPSALEDDEPIELQRRLSTDRQHWEQWLREHPQPSEARRRFGQPFCFEVVLEHLRATRLGRRLRSVLIEELSLRYVQPLAYWPWQRVTEQLAALSHDAQRLGAAPEARMDGTWVIPRRSASVSQRA